MTTECIPTQLEFHALGRREVVGRFDGGRITSDGGGALLRGIDVVFANATGLDVRIAEEPMTCVARGTAIYLENLEEWKGTMESDMDDL